MGQKDVPLDPQGAIEAEAAALDCRGLEIDALFSSPMVRCIRTAEAFERVFGLTMHLMPGLEERAWGCFEGRPKSERDEAGFRSGIEGLSGFRNRILQAFDQIEKQSISPMVITHSGVIRIALYENARMSMDKIPHLVPVIIPYKALKSWFLR